MSRSGQSADNFVVGAAVPIGYLMLALVFSTPVARASESDLATKFTVNRLFEVPGMALQPNTRYTIRLYDSPGSQNVVQVLNGDGTKLLTQFSAISDERLEPADRTTFTFIETDPGYPIPIKEWFYPGRAIGLEFVYPAKEAFEIARHAKEPVSTADSVDLHKLAAVRIEAVSPLAPELPTVVTAENRAKAELPVTERVKPTPAPESAPADTEEALPRESPRTFGGLPLIAALSTVFVGAGLGVKVVSGMR